jgi:uncharacterized protein GlcG (DUF336 family)
MLKNVNKKTAAKVAAIFTLASTSLFAQATTPPTPGAGTDCSELPSQADLKKALVAAQAQKNGGLGFHMWATLVNRDGYVCAVAFSGASRGDQWPGSRVISAQKASTANAFSLPGFALSTANLFAATQNGGMLFGLQFSNPVDTSVAYTGSTALYGQENDPLVGKQVGGVNVFGGGLALYRQTSKKLVGGLGVSGDTSCTDHIIAWKVRDLLNLDNVPNGVSAGPTNGISSTGTAIVANNDNVINDIFVDRGTGQQVSPSGYGHPACDSNATSISSGLPGSYPLGPANQLAQ